MTSPTLYCRPLPHVTTRRAGARPAATTSSRKERPVESNRMPPLPRGHADHVADPRPHDMQLPGQCHLLPSAIVPFRQNAVGNAAPRPEFWIAGPEASLQNVVFLVKQKVSYCICVPASTSHGAVRGTLGVLAALALGLGFCACGGARTGATSSAADVSSTARSHASTHKPDRDNDGDNNDDDGKVLAYGHAAGPAERRIAVALAKRYFAAAAAEDGAQACGLLAPLFSESVVEMDGHSPTLRGRTCATVMSKLFKVHHRLLAEKNASIKVIVVRARGDRMLAVLEFPPMPEERQIEERRVDGTWTVFALLDGIIE